jgi:hypothetical protein
LCSIDDFSNRFKGETKSDRVVVVERSFQDLVNLGEGGRDEGLFKRDIDN